MYIAFQVPFYIFLLVDIDTGLDKSKDESSEKLLYQKTLRD